MGFEFYRLTNGVRVVLVPMSGVRSVGVGVYVGTGTRYETKDINGISHFLEHMVFKGTKKFPTHTDTSYLEGLGAIQNAWTDVNATAYWAKVPTDRWQEGVELVSELAINPTFPEKDLEIERGVVLEEINRREDRPDEIVTEELYQLMFGDNPLGMTTLGDEKVIKTVKREDFVAYHAKQYVASNMVVILAGDVERNKNKIKDEVEKLFGGLKNMQADDFIPVNFSQSEPRVRLNKKDLAQQAHIELAVPGVTINDPRRFALSVLTSYLGQGLSSRLFIELREKRGLCYSVSAADEKYSDVGIWGVYAGLNVSKLEDAVKAILGEIKRLKEVKLTDKEVEAAKEKLRGPMLFSMENPINQMNFFAKQALDKPDQMLTYEDVEKELMKVDAFMIQNVAQSLFKTHLINLAIVGPITKERANKIKGLLDLG